MLQAWFGRRASPVYIRSMKGGKAKAEPRTGEAAMQT